jgi:hypothetical protein
VGHHTDTSIWISANPSLLDPNLREGFMPNFFSTAALGAICLTGMTSCGQKLKNEDKEISSKAFGRLAESIPAWRQCEHTQGYGCSTIRTSGSLVQGSFLFKEIFARCENSESGTQVRIVNSLSALSTLRIIIKIPEPTTGTFICGAAENENGCSVRIQLHTNETGSSNSATCTLKLRDVHPLTGELECKPFNTSEGSIIIDPGSTFSCAP